MKKQKKWGVTLIESCKAHLAECWVSTQPIKECRFLRHLRALAHNTTFSAPLAGEVRRSRVGGLLKNISSALEKVKARMRGHFPFNLINPSPALTGILSRKGRGEQHFGFTLIELLVVVLIMGILAAVALPQYQRAVSKSQFAKLFVQMHTLKQAQAAYFLEHSQYATRLSDLDVTVPSSCVVQGQNGFYCALQKPVLVILSHQYKGKTLCCSYPKDHYAGDWLCQSVTGTTSWSNGCSSEEVCHCYPL